MSLLRYLLSKNRPQRAGFATGSPVILSMKDEATIQITGSSPPELGNAQYIYSISNLQSWSIGFYMSIIYGFKIMDLVSFVILGYDESHTKVSQFLDNARVRNQPCEAQNLRIKKRPRIFYVVVKSQTIECCEGRASLRL